MDVVLEYRVVPVVTNDSLSKRTMSVFNGRFRFIESGSAKWAMMFKLQYIYVEKVLTSWGQRVWSFWESLILAMVKVVHPSMAGENTERTIPRHINVVGVMYVEGACRNLLIGV